MANANITMDSLTSCFEGYCEQREIDIKNMPEQDKEKLKEAFAGGMACMMEAFSSRSESDLHHLSWRSMLKSTEDY